MTTEQQVLAEMLEENPKRRADSRKMRHAMRLSFEEGRDRADLEEIKSAVKNGEWVAVCYGD